MQDSPQVKFPKLQILSYAVGHVMNDMCAACWFSYLLVFLHRVVHLSNVESAVVMFSGQFADGIATPLVGIWSDKSKGIKWLGFGRRKTWLAGGAILVVVCFFMVFGACMPRWFVEDPDMTTMVIYYSIGASLFNVGWAAVQVSHMALVPELSSDNGIRCILNSSRYAFTILSNVSVFCVFLALLAFVSPTHIPDKFKFQMLAYTSLVVGGICVAFFLIFTKEKMPDDAEFVDPGLTPEMADAASRGPAALPFETDFQEGAESPHVDLKINTQKKWQHWFYVPEFYQVGVVYMCTRLVINITQVYMSFFLITTLQVSATSIAVVPLIMYISGFLATFFMRDINEKMGRSGSYFIGSVIVILALTLIYNLDYHTAKWMYAFAVILGIGNSIIMVTSVCMEGDLVGNNVESGAFVYGAMSFTDKVSNGFAIFAIQKARETLQYAYPGDNLRDGAFIRDVMCIFPGIIMIFGLLMACFMKFYADRQIKRTGFLSASDNKGSYGSVAH